MNALLPRFLRSAYRKEPISSFILIVGGVDAVIGGVGERWSLLSVGMLIVILGMILRWKQSQRSEAMATEEIPRRFLPPSSNHNPLPLLTSEKQRRSR
jgi:hypothetical protein